MAYQLVRSRLAASPGQLNRGSFDTETNCRAASPGNTVLVLSRAHGIQFFVQDSRILENRYGIYSYEDAGNLLSGWRFRLSPTRVLRLLGIMAHILRISTILFEY